MDSTSSGPVVEEGSLRYHKIGFGSLQTCFQDHFSGYSIVITLFNWEMGSYYVD